MRIAPEPERRLVQKPLASKTIPIDLPNSNMIGLPRTSDAKWRASERSQVTMANLFLTHRGSLGFVIAKKPEHPLPFDCKLVSQEKFIGFVSKIADTNH